MVTADGPGSFAALLKRYRAAAGLSQEELAERAGLSRRGVSDLERGERKWPRPATVRRLVKGLGLDPAARSALRASAHSRAAVGTLAELSALRLSSLPRPLTSFVGRHGELAEVRGLLGGNRLVTLTGAGGIGKSRLAFELAARLREERPDGVAVVELAGLAEPGLIPQALVAVLGIAEQPRRRLHEVLVDALRTRTLLLVIDNCEHLLAACAELTDLLLRSCPHVTILVTSREPLGVAGETVCRVPPLSLPPQPDQQAAAPAQDLGFLEALRRAESVQLFVERAAAATPEFSLDDQDAPTIAYLCRQVDGIPLALELAAARLPLLSVEQVAERIGDALRLLTGGPRLAPPRQQTLRATLDWSYELLADAEQHLFDRLSVFAGGFALEAAEQVSAGDGIESDAVLDLLSQLVSKSLVLSKLRPHQPARYRLLEPVRQYGRQRLIARGEMELVRQQHAEFFVAVAERAGSALVGPDLTLGLARLEQEHDNLRAALGWLLDRGDAVRAQRIAGALGRFWFFLGYFTEGAERLAQTLALPGGEGRTSERARCLYGAGIVANARGDYAAAARSLDAALALWRELGCASDEGFTLFALGQVARRRGDRAAAQAFLQSAVAVSRAAGSGAPEANSLAELAELAFQEGDDSEARALAESALARASAVGWTPSVATARRILGRLAQRQGDTTTASALLEASLADLRALGFRWWVAWTLADLGHLAVQRRDLARARAWLAESLRLTRELADGPGTAWCLEGTAHLAAVEGQPSVALQLEAAAATLRETGSVSLAPMDWAVVDGWLGPTRAARGAAAPNAV